VLAKKQVSTNYLHATCVSSVTIGKIISLKPLHFLISLFGSPPALDAWGPSPRSLPACTPLLTHPVAYWIVVCLFVTLLHTW